MNAKEVIEVIAADREAQAVDSAVRRRAEDVLRTRIHAVLPESERGFVSAHVIRQAVSEMLNAITWTRPAQAGCDCLAAGGQGLRPSGLSHADDCPAVDVGGRCGACGESEEDHVLPDHAACLGARP